MKPDCPPDKVPSPALRRWAALLLVLPLALGLWGCGRREEPNPRPLACIALPSADDSFMQRTAELFVQRMEINNYRTQAAYCDNIVEVQLRQIQNFIALGADIIAVELAGNSGAYEDVFAQAREYGCRIMVLSSTGTVVNCDVQAKSYHIFMGMRMCELVSEFLDREYPDAGPGSVRVLFMEMSNKEDYIQFCAGYRLIKEQYLRYYDSAALDFVREETGETVYYRDQDRNLLPVEEPAGGLILDGNGHAQRNPFYDERVNLCYATNRNISTNLEGQDAIDGFLATPEGSSLRVVIAFSGDAAIGAAQRLAYYQESGIVDAAPEKLAVFGADDSQANRALVLASARGQSLLRGFVCAENTETKIHAMLHLLDQGGGVYSVSGSSRSQLTADDRSLGMITITAGAAMDPDIYFNRPQEDNSV